MSIKTADWVVDMGPEGGYGGGLVVAEGTPEQVASVPASHTGKFLRDILGADRVSDAAVPAARKARKAPAKKAVAAKTSTARRTATARTAGKPAAEQPRPRRRRRPARGRPDTVRDGGRAHVGPPPVRTVTSAARALRGRSKGRRSPPVSSGLSPVPSGAARARSPWHPVPRTVTAALCPPDQWRPHVRPARRPPYRSEGRRSRRCRRAGSGSLFDRVEARPRADAHAHRARRARRRRRGTGRRGEALPGAAGRRELPGRRASTRPSARSAPTPAASWTRSRATRATAPATAAAST